MGTGREFKFKFKFKDKIALAAFAIVTASGTIHARADIREVGFEAYTSSATGNAGQDLSSTTGYEADVWMDGIGIKNSLMRYSVSYQPYSVRNAPGLNVNVFGAFAGYETVHGDSCLNPFASAQIGFMTDSLSMSGASGATANSSAAFAVQFIGGVEGPVWGPVRWAADVRNSDAFFKTALNQFGGGLSLRWKL